MQNPEDAIPFPPKPADLHSKGSQAVLGCGGRKVVWILAGLCLLIALARWHTYDEPTDRDTGGYAVIAHEVLNGERIYDGVLLDQKPPAIHFTYGVAEWLAGYGRLQVYLLSVAAAIATLIGFYFSGKVIGGSRSAGLWAAVFWVAVSGDLVLEANQPNSEVFINAWTVFGLIFLFGNLRGMIPWRQALLAGICFAMASLYKHVVVVIPMFVGLAYIVFPRPGRNRREAFCDVVIIGLVGVLVWAGLFAYFGATGRFGGVIECLFKFNQYYSGNKTGNLMRALNPSLLFPPALFNLIPLVLLAFGGMIAGLRRREYFPWVALGGLAVGTALTVAMPGKFFPHYYQLWFPFLVIGAALATVLIEKTLGHIKLSRFLAPLALAALLANEIPPYFRPAAEWSLEKYGTVFVETDQLARDIRKWLRPGETFFQLGEEPQLYFDTGQRPTTTLCVYGVFDGPLAAVLTKRTLGDLKTHPPDLLVVGKRALRMIPRNCALWPWVQENYSIAPGSPDRGSTFLCVRKGSDLQQRLASQGR